MVVDEEKNYKQLFSGTVPVIRFGVAIAEKRQRFGFFQTSIVQAISALVTTMEARPWNTAKKKKKELPHKGQDS